MRDSFVFFVKRPPEVSVDEDGLVHICDRTGDVTIERIMRLSTFYDAYLAAGEVMAKWQVGRLEDSDPVPIRGKQKKGRH